MHPDTLPEELQNPRNGVIYDYNDAGRVTGYELACPLLADVWNDKQRIVIADLKRFDLSCWIALAQEPHKLSQQFDVVYEHWFHQAEVHATLLAHGNPRRILGLGAGDFLIAWRALQHPTVSYFEMADWDHDVPRLVLTHVPLVRNIRTHYQGRTFAIQDDPRLNWSQEVDVRDRLPAARKNGETFDVIIGDLPANSLEEILAGALGIIYDLLNPGGVYVYQAGPCSLATEDFRLLKEEITAMRYTFGDDSVTLSTCDIESYAYRQAWVGGWKGRTGVQQWMPTDAEIARIDMRGDRPFYCRDIHRKLYTLEADFQAFFR